MLSGGFKENVCAPLEILITRSENKDILVRDYNDYHATVLLYLLNDLEQESSWRVYCMV